MTRSRRSSRPSTPSSTLPVGPHPQPRGPRPRGPEEVPMTDQPPTGAATAPEAAASSSAQLAPPAEAGTLTLEPPQPAAAVAPERSASMVPLDAAALPGLDRMAAEYVDSLVDLDTKSPEFTAKAESIRTMGDDDIRAAAEVSNRMLQQPVKTMGRGGFDEGSRVSSGVLELRRTIADL